MESNQSLLLLGFFPSFLSVNESYSIHKQSDALSNHRSLLDLVAYEQLKSTTMTTESASQQIMGKGSNQLTAEIKFTQAYSKTMQRI